MSTDLQQAFDRAGRTPPPSTVDLGDAVRQGRRARVRRRAAAGGALVGVGAAVAASVVLVAGLTGPASEVTGRALVVPGAGSSASAGSASGPTEAPVPDATSVVTAPGLPLSSVTASGNVPPGAGPGPSGLDRSPQPPAAVATRLARVTLPDPAPGFPVRRWADEVAGESFTPGETTPTWTKVFGLAVTPPTSATDANGDATGEPTGPEVTLRVGLFAPAAEEGGRIKGDRVVATVPVAGTEGRVTTSLDKGTAVRTLYLHVHDLSVEIIGFDGVTTEQLVALGNALRGLT